MKKEEIMVLALAGVAVLLIIKAGGVRGGKTATAKGAAPETNWNSPLYVYYGNYNYANDESGSKYSETGEDIRNRH